VANDTVIEAANAAAGGLSSAANFIKPGNAVSGWIDKNIIQAGEESQSDVVKASKKKFREGVENADGVMGELGLSAATLPRTLCWLLLRRQVPLWGPVLRSRARAWLPCCWPGRQGHRARRPGRWCCCWRCHGWR
jgi:hypothetical protein